MTFSARIFPRLWLLIPICLVGFFIWTVSVRIKRVAYVSALPEWSVDPAKVSAASPTGYAAGRRQLIVPVDNGDSYQWIAQTQQILATGEWRIRHVDYDNAPFGRETHLPALYRCWLALLAQIDHALTGAPLGQSVEHAALYADPLLLILLLAGTASFVFRHFGNFSGIVILAAGATLYPLAGGFVPGAPDHLGLLQACLLWSVLPLVAVIRARHLLPAARPQGYFILSGVAGGLALWLDLATSLWVFVGIAAGALGQAWLGRKDSSNGFTGQLPWRLWALGGALTSLVAYAWEYFPNDANLRLDGNHPLWALGWIGGGELLTIVSDWMRTGKRPWSDRRAILKSTAALVLLAVPFLTMLVIRSRGPFATDLLASRLTLLNDGVVQENLLAWISREGLSPRILATLLPLLLVVFVARRLQNGSGDPAIRASLVLALGPVMVAAGFACFQLRWWNTFDVVFLVLLAAATASETRAVRLGWGIGVAVLAALGIGLLLPPATAFKPDEFTPTELNGIIERDFSHWLAQCAPQAVVLAPPRLTASLIFHGGLRGIATFDADNRQGFVGAVRIAAAPRDREAFSLIERRSITHVVLPSWDLGLDESAREEASSEKTPFIGQLREWILPLWTRPIAYSVPKISGFESHSIAVLEVGEERSEAALLAEMTAYFIEAGMPGHASELRKFFRRFPTDLGVLVAQAETELLREDDAAFQSAFASVVSALAARRDRVLTWERRINLAAVLVRGGREDLARPQLERCLQQIDEAKVRALTTRSLFRLLVLCKKYRLEIGNEALRKIALELLPPDTRQRILN